LKRSIWIISATLCLTCAAFAQTPAPTEVSAKAKPKTTHSTPKKKSVKKTAVQAKPTAQVTSVATQPAAAAPAAVPEKWSAEYIKKYIIVTPKTGYSHVLIDVATKREAFEGAGKHTAIALQALQLAQSTVLANAASDVVKLDVVIFQNRDNYGSPLWDSMKRLGHLEFSAKALSAVAADTFQKPESDWKGQFQAVQFYDE